MLYISIVALLALSAFFSASETALSTLNKIRLKKKAQDGDARAKTALALSEDYERTITSILIGNNIVNIANSTIAALLFTALLGSYGAVASTVIMTLLVLIFGEILPKSYSKNNADRVVLSIAGPLRAVSVLLRPLSALFSRFTSGLYRLDPDAERSPSITEEELHYFIESIEEEGVLEEEESNLVQSALAFDETTLREIITPRVNIVALDADSTQDEIRALLLDDDHARIPVFEGSIDNVVGILDSRAAMAALVRGERIDLATQVHKPYFVHKGMSLSALLSSFQTRALGMAVVLEEYGGTMGIVTMSDLLDELVGDMWDVLPEGMVQLGAGSYEAQGSCDLEDMMEELGLEDAEEDSDHSTANGWALHHLEHIPEVGEHFTYEGWLFSVLEMDGHRISRLLIEQVDEADEDAEAAEGEQE